MNDLKPLTQQESGQYTVRAFKRQDGVIEFWERDSNTVYGYWQLTFTLDVPRAKLYASVLDSVLTKIK
jgi:hypothetical protein